MRGTRPLAARCPVTIKKQIRPNDRSPDRCFGPFKIHYLDLERLIPMGIMRYGEFVKNLHCLSARFIHK